MATRAKELSDLGNLKLDVTANGIDVVGVASNFKSESYNILNVQTDTDDNGSSDDGIFKITNGSANTTKAEFRWDESEDLVHVSYGDHGRHISIGSDGKVGIATGSTAPSQTLDVNGTAIAEQYLLDAIDKDISDTAVDVFIYDTSKDSDGGAWRKRTQNTSWYNETLNTSTRGARREFPAVAVIVVESDTVTIYDADESDMPMWMVFNSGNYYFIGPTNRTKTCAEMLNGILCIGTTGSSAWMSYISFVDDTARQYSSVASEKRDYLVPILYRNSVSNASAVVNSISNYSIINDNINDLTMIVLPNAIIDSATGLPKPTIAVATNGGVSIIRSDDSVPTNKSGAAYITIDSVGTDYYVTKSAGDDYSVLEWSDTDTSINYTKGTFKYNGNPATNFYPFLYGNGGNVLGATDKLYHSTGVQGVTLWDIEGVTERNALQCNISETHNTGWMPGDIKLATLSDTDDTDVVGGNKITNGDAWSGASGSQSSTPPTGWTGEGGATWATQSGGDGSYIRLYNENNGGAGPNSYMHQTITTVPGRKYTISATQYHHATITVYVSAGTGAGNGSLLDISYNSSSSATPKYIQGTFTATGTTTYINLGIISGTHNYSVGWDDIIVTEAEEDRSVNRNNLQVFGTVPKTPVVTGADLVAYGPFTSSNYLEQTYNSDLDFGTGDFMYSMWIYRNSLPTSTYERWFGTASTSNDERIDIFSNAGTDNIAFYSKDNGVINGDVRITGIGTNVWHCFHFTRQANVYKIYHNGELKGTNVGSSTLANYQGASGDRRTHIGSSEHWDSGHAVLDGKIALAKISGTVPSPEQIKKIYEDEKFLFQENAKATLYGSSDAVTALAYDDDKELLHVGTSAGRSVFQGLRRIDNTTDAVGAAISASNGMVAED